MLTAAECRKVAADCLEVAERMPSSAESRRLSAMARIWLLLAQRATSEDGISAGRLASTRPRLLN